MNYFASIFHEYQYLKAKIFHMFSCEALNMNLMLLFAVPLKQIRLMVRSCDVFLAYNDMKIT